MVDVERSFMVEQPVATVVEYLMDFSRAQDWDPGTLECTRVDPGPVRKGSEWHNVSEFRGRRTELTYRLVRLEDRRLTFVGTNRTATSTDDLTFRPTEGGTLVTYHSAVRFKGLARLADPFLRGEFERLGDELTRSLPEAILRQRP
jgi:carbon monoxide dehydrogenase subunit G